MDSPSPAAPGTAPSSDAVPARTDLRDRLTRMRRSAREHGAPSYDERLEALDKLLEGVLARQEDFVEAISADFGGRPREETRLLEIFPLVSELRHAKSNLDDWMAEKKVSPSWQFRPASGKIVYQPLGVVGIVAAWNYQLYLSLSPLVCALAAGNRVMIKPSELAPRSAELIRDFLTDLFPPDMVTVVLGGSEVAQEFTALPFDHLLFTGSTRVGKLVMKAAAENLTPVTLELGGKSPTIVHESYNLDRAARRIWTGKLYNAGQTCLAPDYLLLPAAKESEFVDTSRKLIPKMYPSLVDNRQYTRLVNERQWNHVRDLVEDARAKGAEVIELNKREEDWNADNRVYPPTLVLHVDDSMDIAHEEIFGPVLPVVTYEKLDDAIAYVNDRPRPLALYYFDDKESRVEQVIAETTSGGVTINDVIYHIAQHELPFGGVGASGMGHYHGFHGFETFSKKKPVFLQAKLSPTAMVRPPYGGAARALIQFLIGK
jgi:coniferyl-aldehyde dehydrogenase